jgi:hypothetical protein
MRRGIQAARCLDLIAAGGLQADESMLRHGWTRDLDDKSHLAFTVGQE